MSITTGILRALGRLVRGLAALAVLLVLVAGVPAALWVVVGWPLPHALPDVAEVGRALTDTAIPDQVLIKILALACWTVWAVFAAAVTAETVAAVRGRSARRVPLAGPLQTVARSLVAAALLTVLPLAPRIPPSAAPLAAVLTVGEPTRHVRPASDPSPVAAGTQPPAARAAARSAAAPRRYVVRPHDTLWGIAEQQLGDPLRWREIHRLNQGRPQPDGRALIDTDPDHIRIWPGWILELPGGTTPSSAPAAGQRPPTPHPARQGPPSPATQPEAAPAPTTASSATPGPASTTNAPADDGRPAARPRAHPAVELPSGAVVGLSLAAAITLALAAARLHRRRRRTLSEPCQGISHSDPLVTPTVRRLRRAVHASRGTGPVGLGADHVTDQADTPPPFFAAASDPGVVAIGQRGGREVSFDLAMGGLALTGPTALGAARSIILSLLARSRLQPNTAEIQVLLVGDQLAERLLGQPAELPGLSVTPDLDTALSTLEVEQAHRLRLLQDHDTADVTGYLHADPAEPLPTVVLVVDLNQDGSGWEQRLAAVLEVGQRLAIGALLLGPAGEVAPTLILGADATIQAIQPDSSLPDLAGALVFTLGPDDTAELLPVLGVRLGTEPEPSGHQASAPTDAAPPAAVPEAEVAPTSQVAADRRPIRVRCLGPLRIELDGAEVRTGMRTKARELLAFLLLHPAGVGREVAIEALWPEMDAARSAERAKDALKSLRQTLRAATGQSGATVIELVSDRWHVNPDLVDCDVWHFQSALAAATGAADDQAKLDALTRAAEIYAGTLLQDAGYEWVEEPREELRRQAADVAGRLAELREQAGDLDGALGALEDGARWDAYNEELYQRIMRLQARMGRLDAVRRTYTRLRDRLADLGVDPDESTERLLQELRRSGVADADGKGRSSGSRPARSK
jgi:DNA-binding SARP family transcriptional activator